MLFRISPFVSEDDFCGVKLPTQSIKHDRFNRGPNNFDEDQDTMKGIISSKAKIITFLFFERIPDLNRKVHILKQEPPIIISKYIPRYLYLLICF